MIVLWILSIGAGAAVIYYGSELFAENLAAASAKLRVSSFALAFLLAGAEPEELATSITAAARGVPALAFGDAIGTNIMICLLAVSAAAFITPVVPSRQSLLYGWFAIPLAGICVYGIWDGRLDRAEGLLLVVCFVVYVSVIWIVEKKPPSLGEAAEVEEHSVIGKTHKNTTGRAVVKVCAGIAAIILGSLLLVEAVRRISGAEETQTKLSLTLVGFATGFELIVLAWSSAKRGMPNIVLAAVLGSFAYNASMTLGCAAVVNPLLVIDAGSLHFPALVMTGVMVLLLLVTAVCRRLGRAAALVLCGIYAAFVLFVVFF